MSLTISASLQLLVALCSVARRTLATHTHLETHTHPSSLRVRILTVVLVPLSVLHRPSNLGGA